MHVENTMAFLFDYHNMPLGDMPILNLFAPMDPMDSKLPVSIVAASQGVRVVAARAHTPRLVSVTSLNVPACLLAWMLRARWL